MSAGSTPSPVDRLIDQQIELIEQQLRLLRNGEAPAPPPTMTRGTQDRRPPSPTVSEHPPAPPGLTPRQQAHRDELIARLVARTPTSKARTQEHRARLADPRTAAGFRKAWKEALYPLVVERSKGCRIWDVDGNEFRDLAMGFGVALLGHSPDFVAAAVEEQLHRGFEIGPQTPLAGEVAELLQELTGMERVAFCNTGSEAMVAAIRVARTVTGRSRIACFAGSYHGLFDEVLVHGSGHGPGGRARPAAPGIPPCSVENVLVLDYGRPESLDQIRAQADELAAVLVEPVQSRHPDLQPVEFLQELRRLTRDLDIPLVFDEMITGFRAHPGGAQALFDVRADLAAYGKAVGGGFPLGVLAGDARYLDALDGGAWQYGDNSGPDAGVTWFAGTFVRHPVALAAARAFLRHLKQQGPTLQEQLNARTRTWVEELNTFLVDQEAPLHLEHFSSMVAIRHEAAPETATLLALELRARGVHLGEGTAFFLSTAHSEEDLAQLARAFRESVAALQDAEFLARTRPPGLSLPPGAELVALTGGQQEIWLATRFGDEASCAFNLPSALTCRGAFDPDTLRRALNLLIQRHEALRTTFLPDGSHQVVHLSRPIEIPLVDLAPLEPREREERLAAARTEEAETPFDLQQGPMVRARIFRLHPDQHQVLLTLHHSICDGWSTGVLVTELLPCYAALADGRRPELPDAMQLSDYVRHVERRRNSPERAKAWQYWQEQLADAPPGLELPTDRPRPALRTYAARSVKVRIDENLTARVKKTAAKLGTTPFVLLLAAFDALLARLANQERLIIGIDSADQSNLGETALVGHCVNLLPLCLDSPFERPFDEHVREVRGRVLDAMEHQSVSYGTLVRELHPSRRDGQMPLVQVNFNVDPALGALAAGDLEIEFAGAPRHFDNFELFVNILQDRTTLEVECTHNTDLFDPETIRRHLGAFRSLLAAAADEPSTRIGALPILSGEDRRTVLREWNQTAAEVADKCLHEWFEEQVRQRPDAPAVISGAVELNYAELDRRADELAATLRALGAGPDRLVGISMARSADLVVAMLGILKSGAAYLPLDPDYPAERLAFMLDDSGAQLLVTSGLDPVVPDRVRVVDLADPATFAAPGTRDGPSPPLQAPTPRNLAYVIYTSGSTGRPKGVMLEHRQVVNFFQGMEQLVTLGTPSVWLAATSISFDISVLELLGTLTHGFTVVVHQDAAGTASIPELLERHQVTHFQCTPSQARLLLAEEDGRRALGGLQQMLVGGEALGEEVASGLLDHLHGDLLNMYGPTETTIWSTVCPITRDQSVSIGRPIVNTQVYVLDARSGPVPIGMPGELFIGGEGVARGYHERPELSAERFVADRFGPVPGARLYRTGDLVKWRPDGTLEYLGRTDFQVKVRGHRIELGEIESALLEHAVVAHAVVHVREDVPGDQRIVAYVIAAPGGEPEHGVLWEFLRDRLPSYMLPSATVVLEEYPLTPNGKIDRRSLPAPQRERRAAGPVAPDLKRSPREEWLYVPRWNVTESPSETASIGTALVLLDEAGVGQRLVERLRQRGTRVVTVRSADLYRQVDEDTYTLNPEVGPEHFAALARDLSAGGVCPEAILHLWLLTPTPAHRPGSSFFHRNLAHGLEVLLSVLGGTATGRSQSPRSLLVVANGTQLVTPGDRIQAEKAAVLGRSGELALEAPQLWVELLDLDLPCTPEGEVEAAVVDAYAEVLDHELGQDASARSGANVTIRGGRRHERSWEPWPVAAQDPAVRLSRDGVYLITGRPSPMARAATAALLEQGPAQVVRVTTADDGSTDDLDAAGDSRSVRSLQADLRDAREVRTLVERVVEEFGRLDGVIHCAGDRSLEDARGSDDVVATISEVRALTQALEGRPVEFLRLLTPPAVSPLALPPSSQTAAGLGALVASEGERRGVPVSVVHWAPLRQGPPEETSQDSVLASPWALSEAEARDLFQSLLEAPAAPEVAVTPVPPQVLASSLRSGDALAGPRVPRTGAERRLAGIWSKVLEIADLGLADDFFKLGGHSLLGVQLMTEIERELGVELPLASLFEAPTVERMARLLESLQGDEAAAAPARFLVRLHPGTAPGRAPLFVVAGAFGNVLNLRPLAQRVGAERPCYGIQARGLQGEDEPHQTIEEQARDYLREVREVQPQGPYLLGGFCSGSVTAHEMALQLEAAGETVALLVLLDGVTPEPHDQLSVRDRLAIHGQRWRRVGWHYPLQWWQERRAYRRRLAAEQSTALDPVSYRSRRIFDATMAAMERYRLEPFEGAALLLRPPLDHHYALGSARFADSQRCLTQPDNFLRPHALRLEIVELDCEPGDHDGFVLEPVVRELAKVLVPRLRDAEVGAPTSGTAPRSKNDSLADTD